MNNGKVWNVAGSIYLVLNLTVSLKRYRDNNFKLMKNFLFCYFANTSSYIAKYLSTIILIS